MYINPKTYFSQQTKKKFNFGNEEKKECSMKKNLSIEDRRCKNVFFLELDGNVKVEFNEDRKTVKPGPGERTGENVRTLKYDFVYKARTPFMIKTQKQQVIDFIHIYSSKVVGKVEIVRGKVVKNDILGKVLNKNLIYQVTRRRFKKKYRSKLSIVFSKRTINRFIENVDCGRFIPKYKGYLQTPLKKDFNLTEAFRKQVDMFMNGKFCVRCFSIKNLQNCDECMMAMYCSEKCQRKHLNEKHKNIRVPRQCTDEEDLVQQNKRESKTPKYVKAYQMEGLKTTNIRENFSIITKSHLPHSE